MGERQVWPGIWNEADGQSRNEALHPVLYREVVVGNPGGRNGVGGVTEME